MATTFTPFSAKHPFLIIAQRDADVPKFPAEAKFVQVAKATLTAIEQTPLGAKFLESLSKHLKSDRKVVIYNISSTRPGNTCNSGPDMNKYVELRQAFAADSNKRVGAELTKALGLKGNDKDDAILDGFAKSLCFVDPPTWDAKKKPIANPLKAQGVAAVTALLRSWADGTAKCGNMDVQNMLLAGLRDKLTPGAGAGSGVYWDCIDKEGVKKRPLEVGLAHELCHAYYSARGLQLGIEGGYTDSTGILYEAITVGLPPYYNNVNTHKYSENAFRAVFNKPPRIEYNV